MSATFDPYHRWLAIPPEDQPPHHYRLLGLKLFETDLDVIESAADRQMSHVRSFQNGRYASESQRILNEISAARVSLLNPQKKNEYDSRLRAQLAPPEPEVPRQPAAVIAPAHHAVQPIRVQQPIAGKKKTSNGLNVPLVAGIGAAVAIVLIVVVIMMNSNSSDPSPGVTKVDQKKATIAQEKPKPVNIDRGKVNPPQVDQGKTNRVEPSKEKPISPTENVVAKTNTTPKETVVPPTVNNTKPPVNETKPITTEGLVAHWTFDENEGLIASDSSGGHDGNVNGATWTTGVRGSALRFDGKSARVDVPNHDQLNFGGTMTMAAWIRPARIPKGITFMNIMTHTGESAEIYLRLCNNQYAVGCYVGRHFPTEHRVPENDVDTWVHLAGVYDGQSWHIYRNGELIKTVRNSAGPKPFAGPWTIGAQAENADRYFQGDIDEVRIYNRALRADEIRSLSSIREDDNS